MLLPSETCYLESTEDARTDLAALGFVYFSLDWNPRLAEYRRYALVLNARAERGRRAEIQRRHHLFT